jgi:hypothetical protein
MAKYPDRALEINSIPQDNGSDHQIEAACAMTLRLKAAVAQFS